MVREGLIEVVQKFPLLEELSLRHSITTEGVGSVGRSCTQLKSSELNNSSYNIDEKRALSSLLHLQY